jgi:hypothetical protein
LVFNAFTFRPLLQGNTRLMRPWIVLTGISLLIDTVSLLLLPRLLPPALVLLGEVRWLGSAGCLLVVRAHREELQGMDMSRGHDY